MIFETVVTTASPDGRAHIAPMGIQYDGDHVVLMPFKPSVTLDNVLTMGAAVVNFTVDVRVFAGCVTGRRDWPTMPATEVASVRLVNTLAHLELTIDEHRDDASRPVLYMRRRLAATHAPFPGFNRAQAAVVEGAVLVSRLHMLPPDKIAAEMAYLQIAIDKTAGPDERMAWGWLTDAVRAHRVPRNAGEGVDASLGDRSAGPGGRSLR